ncbi:MAG: YraN family protein [Huintestinicola sp.]
MRQSRTETGRLGEELTAYYLERAGYEILRRNFRIKGGEIDIIARKDDIIAFVEVKTRDINALESGVNAVKSAKRRLIIRASVEYSRRYPHELQPRFDISDVTVKDGRVIRFRYYDNAYAADEDNVI